MAHFYKGYMMFAFEWTKQYQAYEYAFNCKTGQIVEDHGELDGDEADFRYVVALTALNRVSEIEWDGLGSDVFADDLEEIGKVLSAQAGFNAKDIFRSVPDNGEAIFVWDYRCGVSESTPDGPGEGWSESEYLGELDQLIIRRNDGNKG